MFSKANLPTGNLSHYQTDGTVKNTNFPRNPLPARPAEPGKPTLLTIIAQSFPCWHTSKRVPPQGQQAFPDGSSVSEAGDAVPKNAMGSWLIGAAFLGTGPLKGLTIKAFLGSPTCAIATLPPGQCFPACLAQGRVGGYLYLYIEPSRREG